MEELYRGGGGGCVCFEPLGLDSLCTVCKFSVNVVCLLALVCTHVCVYACVHVCMHYICECVFIYVHLFMCGPLPSPPLSIVLCTEPAHLLSAQCRDEMV